MYNVYTGERVRIRPFKSAGEYAVVSAAEGRRPNEHWGCVHWPAQQARVDFEHTGRMSVDTYSTFAVDRIDTGELVGCEEYFGLNSGSCAAWIGTYIFAEHEHKGFGIEAKLLNLCYLFENYSCRIVIAGTTATHSRARFGLESCGMEYVGARRKAEFCRGSYVDVVQYRIMRHQWERLAIRQVVRRGSLIGD